MPGSCHVRDRETQQEAGVLQRSGERRCGRKPEGLEGGPKGLQDYQPFAQKMEEAVVRQGLLYLQQQQTFGKKWRKFWGVLYKESACATARVELLEGSGPPSVERSRRAESSKRLIKLTDCVYVGEARGEASGPKETVPFLLETTEKCYLLAAERAEAEGWILELCELAFSRSKEGWTEMPEADLLRGEDASSLAMAENSLYSSACKAGAAAFGTRFPVAVRATPASEKCRLWGRFLLCATADTLDLSNIQTGDVIYTWPYKFLRRFGHDKVMFSFEAGRRCASGEGCFEFATKQGSEIIQIIEAAINAHRNLGANGSPAASSRVSLLTKARTDETPQERTRPLEEELPLAHASSTKSLSLEPSWQRKPPRGKAVKPTTSCPLSSTKGVYMALSDAHPKEEPQYGLGVQEQAGETSLAESEYSEPFDTLSRSRVGLEGNCPMCSSEKASTLPVSNGVRTHARGLEPPQTGPEHIYDDPEGLLHLVYDEPQEIKGDAWRLQATAEDPVGHEYPYNPCLDDYAVPKMVVPAQLPLPGQDKGRPEEKADDSMVLKLRKMMNAP